MPYIKVGRENSGDIEIYYQDHGTGSPVVLGHGYPLSGVAWEKQVPMLLEAGRRVIVHDRRGWGKSSHPGEGYDYDTFSADYNTMMEQLDLHDAVLVGHSMGAGEISRYLGTYGSARVSKAVLISPLSQFPPKDGALPEQMSQTVLDRYTAAATSDRLAWMATFLDSFYNLDGLGGTLVSEQAYQASLNIAAAGSPIAAVKCISTWSTDFRSDIAGFDIPILIIQGDQDRVLPVQFTGHQLRSLVRDITFAVISGGPHGLAWTHSAEVNSAIAHFLNPPQTPGSV